MAWDEEKAERFGAVLKALRGKTKLSQESLAWNAGITKNQVQLIESGRASGRKGDAQPSNPRLSTLTGLADALGITVAELMKAADL